MFMSYILCKEIACVLPGSVPMDLLPAIMEPIQKKYEEEPIGKKNKGKLNLRWGIEWS